MSQEIVGFLWGLAVDSGLVNRHRRSVGILVYRAGHRRESTGSDSSASVAKTPSHTRQSGSPAVYRCRPASPRACSRTARES